MANLCLDIGTLITVGLTHLLFQTLYFSFHGDHLFGVAIAADRAALVLDLLKLIAVLANAIEWTKEAEDAQPELYASIHRHVSPCCVL